MSVALFRVKHTQTLMYVARRERPRSEMHGAKSNGAAPSFKWVRTAEEAEVFGDWSSADIVLHFLNYPKAVVVDLNDNTVTREQAQAEGTLIRALPATREPANA